MVLHAWTDNSELYLGPYCINCKSYLFTSGRHGSKQDEKITAKKAIRTQNAHFITY